MKKSRVVLFFLILYLLFPPLKARAVQDYAMPPHLIQTVTERDNYESMVLLGMLECPVLEEADREEACGNVKSCVVRVQMGNAYGSGIIWKLAPDNVLIATNRHVLDYWQDQESFVYFPQGYYVDARVLGVSEKQDVGFLEISNGQFMYRELEQLRYAAADIRAYGRLAQGDEIFCAGSGPEVGEMLSYEATLEDKKRYIEDLDGHMLYGHGFARTGMSGGGIFDAYGHLVGMITGGTLQNEIAGVALPDILEAYEEVVLVK